jgi:GTP-binding protein EngB required for normal cell division
MHAHLPDTSPDAAHAKLAALLDQAASIPGMPAGPLADLRDKLTRHAFNLVVAGEFKRGKSSVINALLGADLLPTGVVPLTSVVTRLEWGEAPTATVIFERGETRSVPLADLPEYVTEKANPKNVKGVREVVVAYPAEWLKGGIRLVDTPGIGSAHRHNTDLTYQYLPQADAVILVAAVDQPMSRAELDFLADIRRYAGKVFCLLNKIDTLTEAELTESVAFATGALREELGEGLGEGLGYSARIFPVSARLARQGRLAESRLPEFDAALRQFLRDERGAVWDAALQRNVRRLLAQARLNLELELKALTAPLAELEAKLAAFAARKQETLQARSDYDALLEADSRKLVKEQIEPDLAAFQKQLLPRLLADLDGWYRELRGQGAAAMQDGLEQRLIEAVRAAYEVWRAQEDARVGKACEGLCERFWGRIQATVDELLRYSAELFAIPYAAETAGSLWQSRSGFYYKFWEEPPALLTLTNGLTRLLPGFVSQPLILRAARRRAADLTDRQAGRLRHDFEERIKESVRDFRRDMLERIEATLAGIETAIGQGRALRQRGEHETTARQRQLAEALAHIAALEARLGA